MQNSLEAKQHSAARLVIFQLIMALLTLVVAVGHPFADPIDETSQIPIAPLYGWVLVQAICLTLPGLLAGLAIGRRWPRLGNAVGGLGMAAIPVVVLCDVLAFNWIGERLLSRTTLHIVTSLLPSLLIHITWPLVLAGIVLVLLLVGLPLLCWKIAGSIARRMDSDRQRSQPIATALVALALLGGLLIMPLSHFRRTLKEMWAASDRHPLCAVRLVGYYGVGLPEPTGDDRVRSQLQGLNLVEDVRRHDQTFASLSLADAGESKPDILFVIVESMRPEVLNPEVTPNLHTLAQEGIWCRSHFATINSTSVSVFSMLNGIEGFWFERFADQTPLATRLFREAGYEVGFFGGHVDGFEHYHMDGFLNADTFDVFQTTEHGGVEIDQQSISRVQRFFERPSPDGQRRPKLAILYYFSTHFDYRSAAADRIFQPAMKGGGVPPYPASLRDEAWNRYKNSMRTMDRFVAPLLDRDRILVVAGDHGEAFLEDGCCSHGLRISQVQCMTPGIVYLPAHPPRQIQTLTNHADFLPTILAALDMEVDNPPFFDGRNLTNLDSAAERIFLTRNYIDSTVGVIGPWTLDPHQPFAYRAMASTDTWQLFALNPINEQGLEVAAPKTAINAETALKAWVQSQFPNVDDFWETPSVDLLVKHLRSEDRETLVLALTLAQRSTIAVDERVVAAIMDATRSPDPAIHKLAREALIEVQRRGAPSGESS